MGGRKRAEEILSHWYGSVGDLRASSQAFYAAVEEELARRKVPGIDVRRVEWHEGGVLSAKREYLQVRRGDHLFHVCAAPFGTGFFVSTWLGERRGWLAVLLDPVPVLGPLLINLLVRPSTYYAVDTGLMFLTAVHSAVLDVLDGLTAEQGLRALTEAERKPVLRDFLAG